MSFKKRVCRPVAINPVLVGVVLIYVHVEEGPGF
jgi:hypothetical protein